MVVFGVEESRSVYGLPVYVARRLLTIVFLARRYVFFLVSVRSAGHLNLPVRTNPFWSWLRDCRRAALGEVSAKLLRLTEPSLLYHSLQLRCDRCFLSLILLHVSFVSSGARGGGDNITRVGCFGKGS